MAHEDSYTLQVNRRSSLVYIYVIFFFRENNTDIRYDTLTSLYYCIKISNKMF